MKKLRPETVTLDKPCRYCGKNELNLIPIKYPKHIKDRPFTYKAQCWSCGVAINGKSKEDALQRFLEECTINEVKG